MASLRNIISNEMYDGRTALVSLLLHDALNVKLAGFGLTDELGLHLYTKPLKCEEYV